MSNLSKGDALKTILTSLSATSGDIKSSAVISIDGLVMASNFPADMDEDRVGAMSAAMHAMGERCSSELGAGDIQQVFVKGNTGFVIMIEAGTEGVLTCICSEAAKLGLIFLDMKRAADEVGRIL